MRCVTIEKLSHFEFSLIATLIFVGGILLGYFGRTC